MHQFSLLTPTFNRAKYLPRVYNSLCQQGDIDFEWIIIDDGSSDDTNEVVSNFKKCFEIKYIFQKNAGKPSAMNVGIKAANSYITLVTLDSDDYLVQNALKEAWDFFDIRTARFQNNCISLSGLCQFKDGSLAGQKFPHDYFVSDFICYHKNNKIGGDKCFFFVTEIIKQYPYPIFEGEKFIRESYIFSQIAFKHKTLYLNKFFQVKEYLTDGLSASSNLLLKNPLSSELYFNEVSIPPYNLTHQINFSSRYIFFAKMNKKKKIFLNAKNKKIFLFGLLKYYFNLIKRRYDKNDK